MAAGESLMDYDIRAAKAENACARIIELLSGKVWSADMLEDVAVILREADYTISDPNEDETDLDYDFLIIPFAEEKTNA